MDNISCIQNCNIKKYSTFQIGGVAKCVWMPQTISQFEQLLSELNDFVIVGSGSNTLFSSDFINKNIILTSKLDKYSIEANILTVQAGVKGPLIANELSEYGLSGLEFLIGFPARFGGAICQNASAQGQAIEDTFLNAKVFDIQNKKELILNKSDMKFEYRHSILSNGNYILLEAQFELKKSDNKQVKETIQKNLEFRKNHQPMLSLPNIGSIFKNPQNNSAGKLFDECGFKGLQIGGAKVWENHANFIVNTENATSFDVLNLMYKMKTEVQTKFNINLKPEIRFVDGENEEEQKLWKLLQK